jgi:hypothetical protein
MHAIMDICSPDNIEILQCSCKVCESRFIKRVWNKTQERFSVTRIECESLETHFYLSADFMKGPKFLNVHERTGYCSDRELAVDCVWNMMAHAQKPDFVFRQIGRVHLNLQGRQFSWLLTAEVCASAVVMLDTPCFEVVWRVLATHFIRQFALYFPSRASPCAITYQLDSTTPDVVFTRVTAKCVERVRIRTVLLQFCVMWQGVWFVQ